MEDCFLRLNSSFTDEEAINALKQLFLHGYIGAVIKTEDYYINPFSGNKNKKRSIYKVSS